MSPTVPSAAQPDGKGGFFSVLRDNLSDAFAVADQAAGTLAKLGVLKSPQQPAAPSVLAPAAPANGTAAGAAMGGNILAGKTGVYVIAGVVVLVAVVLLVRK